MVVATHSSGRKVDPHRTLQREYDTSAANTALTVSTPSTPAVTRRVTMVTASYSASVTKNVTITLNSGAGAAYDNLLATIAISAAADGAWIPNANIFLADDDTLDVTSEAGGATVTCALAVYTEII